jgi:E3 ubiquitin-protein ligase UBR7
LFIANSRLFLEIDEAAGAVLAGSDESKCTHLDGYTKRQALYSCLTCTPEARQNPQVAIGCCLACSLNCHDSHELVELYTKRLFRCDCGVKKGSLKCQLDFSKKYHSVAESSSAAAAASSSNTAQPNNRNRYNQNFSGTYCTCNRPYPDEEDPIEDVMIQCIVCENWYHSRHLAEGKTTPDASSYSEMICDGCMDEHKFLQDYVGLAVETLDPEESRNDTTLNVTSLDDSAVAANEDESESKRIKLSDDACSRPKVVINEGEKSVKATFWKEGWRQSLCQCPKCTKMYEDAGVDYLIDTEDTVHYYEQQGKNKPKRTVYDSSLLALSNLPHSNQIDAISGYNRMKEKLFEFLQSFVTKNQIVTDVDIKNFFRNMKEANENQNQSVHQPPHFCR